MIEKDGFQIAKDISKMNIERKARGEILLKSTKDIEDMLYYKY